MCGTTWREVSVNGFKWYGTSTGQVAEGGVASRGAPFMVPLVCAPNLHTTEETKFGKNSAIDRSVWVMVWGPEELLPPQWSTRRRMVNHGSSLSDGVTTARNGGRPRRGSSSGSLDKMAKETRQGMGGEVNPGERWFNLETSPSER